MKDRARLAGLRAGTLMAVILMLGGLALGAQDEESGITVNGAGTDTPFEIYQRWFDGYHKLHPEIMINYQFIGSGGGIHSLIEGVTEFGASDGPMSDEQIKALKEKRGCNVLHLPTVLRGVVPTCNIPGVTGEIKFTGKALAEIYLGTITKWNDPEIQNANPALKLPANEIVVVHRGDGSGVSWIWTDYLCKISNEWKEKAGAGTYVKWPLGLGGKGDSGVADLVQKTPNSLGYVELDYAVRNKLSYGSVQNPAGKFIKADSKSLTAAAAGAAETMPEDFRAFIANAPGDQAYPVAGFTWFLVPDQIKDADDRKALIEFLKWMLTDGQKMTEATQFAPLPPAIVEKAMKAIEKVH